MGKRTLRTIKLAILFIGYGGAAFVSCGVILLLAPLWLPLWGIERLWEWAKTEVQCG